MDEAEVQQNNMISNLPLLFANGYPTSLDKITELQLENFIPFMVQCSLGHINLQGKIDYSEPEWWPENVIFSIPFSKPKKFAGNWMEKMKEIVIICYQFHKSVFLLRFCNDLAAYEHASLRFINNYNSTTSLFDRRSNKLLVTFRNENMSYDQPQRNRKCLLQQKTKHGNQFDQEEHHMMVEPAPFDIYLCDNCDAELYSKEAILEHEKTCNVDDDVILCDTPEPLEENQMLNVQNKEQNDLRIDFLLNFNLQNRDALRKNISSEVADKNVSSSLTFSRTPTRDESSFMVFDKSKRLSRRNRAVHSLSRCPTIPLSSPAGQLLLRSTKTIITKEYLSERLERVERFCHAPALTKCTVKPKYFERKLAPNNLNCTFKKPQKYNSHIYVFPRRQFSQKRRTENFMFLNSPLIKKCRPISVRLKKISDNEIQRKKNVSNAKLNIKLTRDTTRSSNWKISSPSTEIIVDTIDLCTSEDELDTPDETCQNSTSSTTVRSYCKAKSLAKLSSFSPESSYVENHIESKLRRVKTRFNKSELTLAPIKNNLNSNLSVSNPKMNTASSSVIEIFHSVCTQPRIEDSNSVINARLSATSAEGSNSQLKPLQPSVFIFSNYVTSPLTAISSNASSEAISQCNSSLPENLNFQTQNQENHLKKLTISNCSGGDARKSSSAALTPNISANKWLSHSNSITVNNNIRNSGATNNIAHTRIADRERTSRSLPLMQSFGSPSRIVSIDLTS